MGFEPRAAERLRMMVASAKGGLDDIAHLIGEASDPGDPAPATAPETAPDARPARGGRTRSVA
jgi:hypothetical protein